MSKWRYTDFGQLLFQHKRHDVSRPVPRTQEHDAGLPSSPHGLWRYEAWRYIDVAETHVTDDCTLAPLVPSEKLFENIEPAIRLASILLDRAEAFLIRIYCAPLINDPNSEHPVLATTWTPSEDDPAIYRKVLLTLLHDYRIGYTSSMRECSTIARTVPIMNSDTRRYKIFTGFAKPWLSLLFRRNGAVTTPQLNRKRNYHVALALALVQELAQAIWWKRRIDCHKTSIITSAFALPIQPKILPYWIGDLSTTIMIYLFGCTVHLEQNNNSTALIASTILRTGRTDTKFTLSAATISSFFRYTTWSWTTHPRGRFPLVKLYLQPKIELQGEAEDET